MKLIIDIHLGSKPIERKKEDRADLPISFKVFHVSSKVENVVIDKLLVAVKLISVSRYKSSNDINIYIIKVSNLPRVAVTENMEKPNKHNILLSLISQRVFYFS